MCCSKSWKAVSFGQSVDIRVLRTTKGEEVKNGVESVGARPRAEATEEKGQRKVDVVPPPPTPGPGVGLQGVLDGWRWRSELAVHLLPQPTLVGKMSRKQFYSLLARFRDALGHFATGLIHNY